MLSVESGGQGRAARGSCYLSGAISLAGRTGCTLIRHMDGGRLSPLLATGALRVRERDWLPVPDVLLLAFRLDLDGN